MFKRFRRVRPDGAHASRPPSSNGALPRAVVACALAIALEGCGETLDKEHLANLACQPDAVRACLEVAAEANAGRKQIVGKQLPALAKAGARCAEFMGSWPAPQPHSSPGIRFWPNTVAGRYHESLLRKCGDLWVHIRMQHADELHLRLARQSARQFFEHCLGSMSRRKMTDFETKLYCFDLYVTLTPLVDGYPHQYWAYMVYRADPDKDPGRFHVVAGAFCGKFGNREACDDLKQLDFQAETN